MFHSHEFNIFCELRKWRCNLPNSTI